MKRITICGTICLLAGLMLWSSAPAQELRLQSRAKVWDVYWNQGAQGVRQATPMSWYRPTGMQYPGKFWVQYPKEFINYWGTRDWGVSGWRVWYNELNGTMPGFNTFVATLSGGEYHVSESKANLESEDVVGVGYDPSLGPEAKYGYKKVSPLGPEMSNWYPGQAPPGADIPVEIHNYRYSKYMEADKDDFPENTIISNWTTKNGITVTKKAYAWSYQDFDDFELLEYTFENTGDLQLNDTFLIFSVRFYLSQAGQAHYVSDSYYRYTLPLALDDWYKYTEAANFDGPAAAQGLKMWYAFDSDNPEMPGNDIGKPYSKERAYESWHNCCLKFTKLEGELGAFQHVAIAPLAYTPGAVDDPSTFTYDTGGDESFVAPRLADQPQTVKWWDYRTRTDYSEPGSENMSSQQIYEAMTSPAGFIQDNPAVPDGVNASFSYGPYDLAPGDKVRIVYALVAAAPVEENIQGWANAGKQADMETSKGHDNLLKHYTAAANAWKWGYDLPDPPPDVLASTGASVDGFNQVTWTNAGDAASDPDYAGGEAQDIAGYRVYKSEFKVGDWKLVADVPKGGSYSYEDKMSVAGFEYFYRVAAYDTGHDDWNGTGTAIPSLEGGHSSPEQWANGVLTNMPYVPANASADAMQKQIRVVPNPYRVDGVHNYPTAGLMRFLNVPTKAKIRIYTVAGELIQLIDHNDPTKGEASWNQTPMTGLMRMPAGVYYWVVESMVPGSLGQTQRGTLMLVK